MTMEKKKPILNLVTRNFRRGNFSDLHAMVDVYLVNEDETETFISTYQWNPVYDLNFIWRGCRLIANMKQAESLATFWGRQYGRKAIEYFGILKGTGKYWNMEFESTSARESLLREFWGYIGLFKPDLYEIESCLTQDAEIVKECVTFQEFCDSLGYDSDSISAHKIYEDCQKVYDILITTGRMRELEELHEDD